MQDERPSTTALVTARMRWIHTSSDPKPIIHDAWGEKFAAAAELAAMAVASERNTQDAELADDAIDQILRASPAYANVIVRTWYTESALLEAIRGGIDQYVLIGAGFDSYACRRPTQAQGLQIYEIDHPATQRLKIERLAQCGVEADDNLHFISADLGRETLQSALNRSNFDGNDKAFFSWLGVTMYLTREANMATLESVATCCAPGSQLVFSYVDQAVFDAAPATQEDDITQLKQTVNAVGEPFVSGFHPDQMESDLAGIGLALEEDIDDLGIIARCDPDNANALASSAASRLARVVVKGTTR